MKNKDFPEIRFSEFSENWKQYKIGELLKINSGRDYKHLQQGNIPVYGTGGYMLSVNDKLSDQDAIGIGRKGTIDKPQLLKAPFWTVDTLFYMVPKEKNDLEFCYTLTNKINWKKYDESTGVPSLSKFNIEKISISIPTSSEQSKIGVFFKQLDKTIVLHQQELDALKQIKHGFLQKMFPKEGSSVPELRFSGFTGKWETKNLGELCDITTGKLDANAMKEDGKYDFYTSGIRKYKIDIPAFEGPAITIAGNGATVGYMHYADGKFNAYQRTYVLTNFKADRSFLYSVIGNNLPKKIKQEARTGNIPYIVMDTLTELHLVLPTLEEQQKIGKFLKKLDDVIFFHERELNALKETKKAFLQKMFI